MVAHLVVGRLGLDPTAACGNRLVVTQHHKHSTTHRTNCISRHRVWPASGVACRVERAGKIRSAKVRGAFARESRVTFCAVKSGLKDIFAGSSQNKMLPSGVLCLCLVALTSAAPSPKRQGVDVEKTVAQVEQVLRQNVNLPRLSRDDILQLLNDIRAEDERSTSASAERVNTEPSALESDERERERIELNEISDEGLQLTSDLTPAASFPPKMTTHRPPPQQESLMVVLPYTPRDGANLQELYTRPPRVALLSVPSPMRSSNFHGFRQESKDSSTVQQTFEPLKNNNSIEAIVVDEQQKDPSTTSPVSVLENASDVTIVDTEEDRSNASAAPVPIPVEYPDVSADLREFLELHGLRGNPGAPEDHFLLPLDGFKPLPPIREIDGSIELPEKILLTYDLVSSPGHDSFSEFTRPEVGSVDLSPETFVYEPLRPELPFELDALASETQQTVVPLTQPLNVPNRKRKAVESAAPNFSPIDYDSVKVIPLETGPDPLSFNSEQTDVDVKKRQSENATTTEASTSEGAVTEAEVATTLSEGDETTTTAPARDSASADSVDAGPSIADLESSFGAPAPEDASEALLPPPRKNGFYWMLDWNSFLEVGDGDEKVNIRFEPKLGDPQMFLPVSVP